MSFKKKKNRKNQNDRSVFPSDEFLPVQVIHHLIFRTEKGGKMLTFDLISLSYFFSSYCLAGDVFCQINPKAP